MIYNRFLRMICKPFSYIFQRVFPVKYAKKIGVHVGQNNHFYGPTSWGSEPWLIKLGNNVYITGECKFINHDGGTLIFRKEIPDLEITKPIVIGNNVYIGEETMILPGVTIGNNVIIGARSLVTKDIPSNCVAAGHPAHVIKSIDEYLSKIEKESLHLGHLKGKKKNDELRKLYKNYN